MKNLVLYDEKDEPVLLISGTIRKEPEQSALLVASIDISLGTVTPIEIPLCGLTNTTEIISFILSKSAQAF
ncbi:MAG: hypothetical protein WCP79_06780 [Bacillota bacterium]